MKKLFVALLCLLFTGLCACRQIVPEETTVTSDPDDSTQEIYTKTTDEITEETFTTSIQTVKIKTDKDDPYSYVIEEYLENYYELLDDPHSDTPPLYYLLNDIDGNGVKELLIGTEEWDKKGLAVVYTIQNGAAVHQKEFWWPRDDDRFGLPVLFKNGTIKATSDDYGDLLLHFYYRFENGELKLLAELVDFSLYLDRYKYCKDGNEDIAIYITKAEFDRLQKEFEGDGQTVELDWKPLAEYGR
jgi:hypothetical protein